MRQQKYANNVIFNDIYTTKKNANKKRGQKNANILRELKIWRSLWPSIFEPYDDMDYSNSSSSEDDVSHSSNSTNKRKRQKHVQSFVDAWLTEKQFKDWLCKRVGKNNTAQPFCKVWCSCQLHCVLVCLVLVVYMILYILFRIVVK